MPAPREQFSGKTLLEQIERFGPRPAVGVRSDFGLRWWSFATLAREAQRFACLLRDSGATPGARVVLWGANSPEWVACLVGAMLQRVIVVPVDEQSTRDFVLRVCEQASPCLVVHDAEIDAAFLPVATRTFGDVAAHPLSSEAPAIADSSPDDAAVVVYTSGTTSEPRGVVLTYGNLHAQIEPFLSWRRFLRVKPIRMAVVAPLSHVQGLFLGAMLPLSLGLSVVFVRSVHPTDLLRTIRDNRIVVLSTVPRVLHVLTTAVERRPWAWRGKTVGAWLANESRGWMRRHILFTALNGVVGFRFWVVLVGGAALSRYDEQFWRDTGRFVIQGYGLTETTAIVAVNGPFSRRTGSLGKPLKHLNVKISEDGEVLVKGASVTPGYFGAAAESHPGAGDNGYFHTGDLVMKDADGRLYFTGRKKDVIVTGEGFNVYPADVESALNRHADVFDSVVLGRNAAGGEEVHAVVVLVPGGDSSNAIATANAGLAEHQRIRSWTVWPEPDFPRSALMKVKREAVAASVHRGTTPAAPGRESPALSLAAIGQISDRKQRLDLLVDYVCQTPTERAFEEQALVRNQLELSSLDFVQLLSAIERRQGRLLDPGAVPAEPTLAHLRAVAHSGAAAPARARRLPVSQPKWAETPIATALRRVVRPTVLAYWSHVCRRCSATWRVPPDSLRTPVIFAAAPHLHWLDAFAVCSVMPSRLANRLLIVTNRDFSEYFDPNTETPRRERLVVGAAYYLGLPWTFPFTIVPHFGSTREGLLQTGRMVDRGYSPLVFPKGIHWGPVDPQRHDRGFAALARECGIPIVPVWLSGNEGLNWRPSSRPEPIRVTFGEPVDANPHRQIDAIIEEVESRWHSLAGGAGRPAGAGDRREEA